MEIASEQFVSDKKTQSRMNIFSSESEVKNLYPKNTLPASLTLYALFDETGQQFPTVVTKRRLHIRFRLNFIPNLRR